MNKPNDVDAASDQPIVNASWWNTIYDPKEGRPLRDIPYTGTCGDCGKCDGHRLDCPKVDSEALAKMLLRAQKQEALSKERAKRYWEKLQRAIGKVAVLKHENNKLRKENERLRSH